jgi:capsular polysaccharide biosynthesis protein
VSAAEAARRLLRARARESVDELLAGAARSSTVPPSAEDWTARARLAGGGPWDALLDEGDAEGLADRFDACSGLLAVGGGYVVRGRRRAAALRAHVAVAAEVTGDAAPHELRELRDGAVVVQRRRLLATMREREMNEALDAEPERGRVLVKIPGGRFEPRSTVRENVPSGARSKEVYKAPPLFLREYRDVVCRTKGVVTQRGLVLPDTFRHNRRRVLSHQTLRPAGDRFVVAPAEPAQLPRLDGVFYHLDNEHRGFFGHALTEQLANLWGWERTKALEPDARLLVSTNRGRGLAEWERVLMRAAGIEDDRVEVIDGPVRVDRLFAATPMFFLPHFVHPAVVDTWDTVGAALRAQAGDGPWPRRVFLSRRVRKRACTNRAEVEALFTDHGFTVVYPEDHSLPDQAMLVHEAEVVAGFKGSQMFSLLFTDRPKHVVLLGSSSYLAANEYLIAAVRGHHLDVTTSRSLVPRREDGYSREAFRSDFTFDFDHEGVWLRDVLARL